MSCGACGKKSARRMYCADCGYTFNLMVGLEKNGELVARKLGVKCRKCHGRQIREKHGN